MSSSRKINAYHVIILGCTDDPNWTDNKYGDGTSKCTDIKIEWCDKFGDYSTEAKMFCPLACGVCPGRF